MFSMEDDTGSRYRCLLGDPAGGGKGIQDGSPEFEVVGAGSGKLADHRNVDFAKLLDDNGDLR
jgi:hypothetical protein